VRNERIYFYNIGIGREDVVNSATGWTVKRLNSLREMCHDEQVSASWSIMYYLSFIMHQYFANFTFRSSTCCRGIVYFYVTMWKKSEEPSPVDKVVQGYVSR
jgi:hypothetical protein